jgi:preprotein translocase subunit SecD
MQVLLEVDCSKLNISEKKKEEVVKTALEIIRNRIDQFGVAEPLIQRAGKDRIIIQLPGLKNFGRAKDLIGKTALLEFKLFADKDQIKATYAKLDKYLQENFDKYPFLKKVQETDNVDNVDVLGNDEVKSDQKKTDLFPAVFPPM